MVAADPPAAASPPGTALMTAAHNAGLPQLFHRYWRPLLAIVLLLFFWSWLCFLFGIVYTYASWYFLREISWAKPPGLVANSSFTPSAAELPVPKLLHQTWKTSELPERWRGPQQSCIAQHPDYTYKLWTDDDAEQLIAEKFPWFLSTYKKYPYTIQRVDAMRYFVLYEYGGIYLDVDIICNKSLDYLRAYSFVAPKTYPVGISNDVLVSRPRDAFAHRLITNLASWNQWLFIKYGTVMFSTGPMFVTAQYAFHPDKDEVHVLPADVYGKYGDTRHAYMTHLHGSSWHGGDSGFIFWMEHNGLRLAGLLLLVACSAVLGFIVLRWSGSLKGTTLGGGGGNGAHGGNGGRSKSFSGSGKATSHDDEGEP